MNTLKNLLLPLALVFGAIAVFETGARYGATNMRAHAIANALQLPLSIYISGQSTMEAQAIAQWATIIDHGIATGAIHRQLWYLSDEAKGQLDKALTFALSVRGDATAKRYELIANSEEKPSGLSDTKLKEIQSAINSAKVELIDTTPKEDGPDQLKDAA
jgi:hypothetical protein